MKKVSFGLVAVAVLGIVSGCGMSSEISAPDVSSLPEMDGSRLRQLGEQTAEFIENNEIAQQAQQAANQALAETSQFLEEAKDQASQLGEQVKTQANQALQEAKDQANQLGEQVKNEANKHYQQLKEDTKGEVKNSVNQKIDQAFDRI